MKRSNLVIYLVNYLQALKAWQIKGILIRHITWRINLLSKVSVIKDSIAPIFQTFIGLLLTSGISCINFCTKLFSLFFNIYHIRVFNFNSSFFSQRRSDGNFW